VFQRAVKSSDGCFTLLARNNDLGRPRLGLAISRKFAKTAVARNRIKRIVRESFRLHQAALSGLDIVVLARDNTSVKPNRELRASLTRHWARLVEQCEKS
jgi:ribonuclease P protein component